MSPSIFFFNLFSLFTFKIARAQQITNTTTTTPEAEPPVMIRIILRLSTEKITQNKGIVKQDESLS